MSSNSKLNFWKLSISLAFMTTAAGIVGPISSPAAAQPGLCEAVSGSSLKGVPASVLKAAQKAASPLKVTQLNGVEVEDGIKIYELGGKQKNGCPFEVDIIAPGKLDEVESQLSSVPGNVNSVLKSQVPGYKVNLVEKSVRPGGVVVYETEGVIKGVGYEVDVQLEPKIIIEKSKAS